jgi:glycosyltransferase involved in cell wall biosynthesis
MSGTFPISIITPSYQQAAYLEFSLKSVLAQDIGPIEYLVVDGGSQDGSQEIIQRYSSQLAWWVSEPDSGQAEAINKGLQQAQGEIVAWLNSDDLYLPGALAEAVAVLQAEPELGMVFGDAITIDADGRYLNTLAFGNWGLSELISFRIICQPAIFMRRSVLEKVGFLDTAYHYMLDHQLWIRMASQAPIRHVDSIWAAARHHPDAKNVAQSAGFGAETQRLLAWIQNEPSLAPWVEQNRRRVEGGAYRLTARYLLDGGQPSKALKFYGRSLRANPAFAMKHWHRMLYAALSLVGMQRLSSWYFKFASARQNPDPRFVNKPGLRNWPGLVLEKPN